MPVYKKKSCLTLFLVWVEFYKNFNRKSNKIVGQRIRKIRHYILFLLCKLNDFFPELIYVQNGKGYFCSDIWKFVQVIFIWLFTRKKKLLFLHFHPSRTNLIEWTVKLFAFAFRRRTNETAPLLKELPMFSSVRLSVEGTQESTGTSFRIATRALQF